MRKKKHIDAKPTIYRSVLYKSRLEARWAVLLDNCINVLLFKYEPITIEDSHGWGYTPDFLVTYFLSGPPRRLYLEIKPNAPTGEYLNQLTSYVKKLKYPLMLIFGSLYKDEPLAASLLMPHQKGQPVHPCQIFSNFDRAYEIATSYRFDL